MKLSFKSLRVIIASIVISIFTIVITFLVIFSYNSSANELEKTYKSEYVKMSTKVGTELDDFINRQKQYARALAENPFILQALRDGNYTNTNRMFARLIKNMPVLQNIFIGSPNRRSKIISGALPASIGVTVPSSDAVKAILAGKEFITSPYKSVVTGTGIIVIYVPIKEGNRVKGILGLPIELGNLSYKIVKETKLGKTGYFFLCLKKGLVFAHPDKSNEYTLDLAKQDFGATLLNLKNSELGYYTFQGKKKLAAAYTSTVSDFKLIGSGYTEDYMSEVHSIRNNMILAGLIGLLIAVFIIYYFLSWRLRPLENAKALVTAIAKGDLTKNYTGRITTDEIGDIVKSITDMTDKLRQIVSGILISTQTVASSSEEISATAESLSESSNTQASNVEEITSSLEEVGATITQNTENSRKTNSMANKAAGEADEGGKAVSETVSAMTSISEKISIIEDIAYQTNLLALNAAIEAARAGEHGKGFAVVAGEVRKLAEKSQDAAQDINNLATNSVSIATKAGELLKVIVPSIKETAQLVQDITIASEEQDTGVNQINLGMDQLNQVTQQTAAASEELASTSESLSDQAQQLQEQIEFFKIDIADADSPGFSAAPLLGEPDKKA